MTSISLQEQNLIDRWKAHHPSFVIDGLINEEAYLASPLKVVFAMKDAYDNTTPLGEVSNSNLCDYIRSSARGHTWASVARWCYGLKNIHRDIPWQEVALYGDNAHPDKLSLLRAIGVMNMKKVPSPQATTDIQALKEFAKDPINKEFLHEQWQLYKPQLTICAGRAPFEIMLALNNAPHEETKFTKRGQRYWRNAEGQVLFESCHPAAQYPAATKYYMTMDAIREIFEQDKI